MATVVTCFDKDADVPYVENAGYTSTGDEGPSFRIFVGATESSYCSGTMAEGKERAATGCSNTAGKFTVTSSSYENGIAITRYLCIKDSVVIRCCVDTSAVVAGCVKPAIVDTAKFGVVATDAGTNCDENGKSRGDADPVVAEFTVGVTIFAFGGAGFTITVTSSKNITIVVC